MKKFSRNQVVVIVSLSICFLFLAGCTFQSLFGGSKLDWSSHEARLYDDKAELISVTGGEFNMGTNSPDAKPDEKPEHKVRVADFQIYSHEVTNAMYAECVHSRVCMAPGLAGTPLMQKFLDPAYKDFPVIGVDWNMAADYCEFTGGRLPTEAEWEYAASGGIDNIFPWGNEMPTCDLLNMRSCQLPDTTVAGGSYPDGKTASGLYDMAGNTWEWVYDWYAEDAYASAAGTSGASPSTGTHKVARGGGFNSLPARVKGVSRQMANPIQGFDDVGFRCVKNGAPLPADIALPPDGHSPTTPEGGVEDPDDPFAHQYIVSSDGIGFDCVDVFTRTFHVGFTLEFGGPDPVDPVSVIEVTSDNSYNGEINGSCTVFPLGGNRYGVGCTAGLPTTMGTGDLPAWANVFFTVSYGDSSSTISFTAPIELAACRPGDELEDLSGTATVSCPDASGLVEIGIDQTHPVVPEFLSFTWNGLTIDGFCTDLFADHISCSGVPAMGGDSLTVWVGYPGDELAHSFSFPITREDCSGGYDFSGEAVCLSDGGYAVVVTVSPTFAGSWKVAGLNVAITANTLTAADVLRADFADLPPAGEDIRYMVCMRDPVTDAEECTEFSTPQPDCGGPSTFNLVDLISYGCDPDTRRFFASFSHNMGAPNFSFLTVANNTTPMACIDLGDAGHTIYCTSAMSPAINQVVFQYTDPAHMLNDTWDIGVEPCPSEPEEIDCSGYGVNECNMHQGCTWRNGICARQ